ncbi:MAG: hypothetical protein MK209_08905 [Planctomycetes bacterium]|nr:hypothetical protein [Planctomycetota bacterium]
MILRTLLVLLWAVMWSCDREVPVNQRWERALPQEWSFGQAVDATLVRTWPEGWRVSGFDANMLDPLEVEELSVQHTERGGQVREVRRLRLRAWQIGDLSIALPFAVQGPDREKEQVLAGADLRLIVRSVLSPKDAGQIEGAPPIPNVPAQGGAHPLAALTVVLLYLAVVGWSARRRPVAVRAQRANWDPWDDFARVQLMPGDTEEQRSAARIAARELLRALEPGRAWGGEELTKRVIQRYALPPTEAESLRALVKSCEQSLFGDEVNSLPLDQDLDELADVLHAVEGMRS